MIVKEILADKTTYTIDFRTHPKENPHYIQCRFMKPDSDNNGFVMGVRNVHEKRKEQNIPLFGLESQEPIKTFDFIGITLQYEMCYTNVLQLLDLAQIPLLAKDRSDGDPIVMGGGLPLSTDCHQKGFLSRRYLI